MRRTISRISDILNRVCLSSAMAFFGLMLALVIFQVAARYLFRAVPPWTDEAIRYCMVWGGMLGATVAFKTGQDPRLFKVSPGAGRIFTVCSAWFRASAVVIFLGPVLWYSDKFLIRTWHRTAEGLGIPVMWVSLAVPAAAAVILCHVLAGLAETGTGKQTPEA